MLINRETRNIIAIYSFPMVKRISTIKKIKISIESVKDTRPMLEELFSKRKALLARVEKFMNLTR